MPFVPAKYEATFVEMSCIGDYADAIVYCGDYPASMRDQPSLSVWLVPGSWEGRDEFGRKVRLEGHPNEA